MLYLIHGDDKVKSREKRLLLINDLGKDKEVVSLDGRKIDLNKLKKAIEERSLFGGGKVVVVDDLGMEKKEILNYISKLGKEENLVIWEGKEVKKSVINKLKKFKIENFKISNLMFLFLDNLGFDKKKSFEIFKRLGRKEDINFIFQMIIRQFRLLILTKSEAEKGPSDFSRLAGWQKSKLTKQGKKFTMDKLKRIYNLLLETEKKIKTGGDILGLKAEVEKLILSIYD